MLHWCLNFARSQSRDEVGRQYAASARLESRRLILAFIPYAVATLYLPVWLCVTLALTNACLETVALRMLGSVDPPRQPGRYLVTLGLFVVSQIVFSIVSSMVWQNPDGFAKSFAIGMFFVNLVHLTTVRSVHLPLTLTSLAAATTIAFLGNGYYWVGAGNWTGFAVSSFCLVATIYFVGITLSNVNQLYQEMYRERQAAEAANDAKSRFLAQMSHELRTPLNAILGMGYAELTAATAPQSRDRLTTMVQSARNLSVLLDDILDLSAVQAGQLPIRPHAVNLRIETTATLALFGQQIVDAGMTLDVSFAEDVPELTRLDGQRYRQCLSNVVSNAIKYANPGRIEVKVSAPPGQRIEVVISDSGPGVPEHLRDVIFEPFQRGESLISGTGLGLSISRTLARRMGGDLVLLPDTNGARFLLSFAQAPALPSDQHSQTLPPLANLHGKRVLVVDDIATNRLVAITYLQIMGATTTEAATGAEALAAVAQDPPDCVLLDMLMPDMDGLATLGRLRALPGASAKVAVIAMTADATEEHRRHYLSTGLDGYVAKPLVPELLGKAIQAALAARRV